MAFQDDSDDSDPGTGTSRVPVFEDDWDYKGALALVAGVPVLRGLPKSSVPLLVQSMSHGRYASEAVVIRQGEVNDRLFIVVSGNAEVVRADAGGDTEVVLVTLSAGDYFGEQEVLRVCEARATVRACGAQDPALITYSVNHATFWELGLHEWLCIPRRSAVVKLQRRSTLGNLSRPPTPGLGLRAAEVDPSEACALGATSEADCKLIAHALRTNALLSEVCQLTDEIAQRVASAARLSTFAAGEVVVTQDDRHNGSLYVVRDGDFQIAGKGQRRGSLAGLPGMFEEVVSPGGSFGEMELIYSSPWLCTVTARSDAVAWVIGQADFASIFKDFLESSWEAHVEVLRCVPLFAGLYREELQALAEAVTEECYVQGETVYGHGDVDNSLFILKDGEAVVESGGVELRRLAASPAAAVAQHFGEEELVSGLGSRQATARITSSTATVLSIEGAVFEHVLQPLGELLESTRELGDARESLAKTRTRQLEHSMRPWLSSEPTPDIQPADLEVWGQLGAGGEGTVTLVEDTLTGCRYALKKIRKSARRVQDASSRRMAINDEETILSMTCSPFVIRLFSTFQSDCHLQMLLEFAPGGDLLHALYRYELFGDASVAMFYSAGLALALSHLHQRRILHRDVKPENVLLDAGGWPKLSDFGLAKFCVGKAFTICGTPPYLAPETWMQHGSGPGADWWSFGIVLYEMMAGCTPFEGCAGDGAGLCRAIKRGIPCASNWEWPDAFTEGLQDLVCGLLQPRAGERLPVKHGDIGLKAHAWYAPLQWDLYEQRCLDSPRFAASLAESPAHALLGMGREPAGEA